jgi:hypothetical protein
VASLNAETASGEASEHEAALATRVGNGRLLVLVTFPAYRYADSAAQFLAAVPAHRVTQCMA